MDNAGIPEWVMWLGAAGGSMAAAFVLRMGWKSAGGEKKGTEDGKTFVLDAALVDSGAVKQLAAAIEAHTVEAIAQRVDAEKSRQIGYRMIEAANGAVDELAEIRREIGDLAKEIARSK
jgi:hypothetical protein